MILCRAIPCCVVLAVLSGCATRPVPAPPIVNIPALIGKPYSSAQAIVSAHPLTATTSISSNDEDAHLRGGTSYTYTINGTTLDLDVSPAGEVRRVEAAGLEPLGYSLDDASEALARFGINAPEPADVSAAAARRWEDIGGNTIAAVASEPGGKIWQVQAAMK